VKSLIRIDYYFFVTRSRIIFGTVNNSVKRLSYEVFIERFSNLLEMDKTIVIDEFQRLPEDFYDFLHYYKTRSKAKIILVGSSIHVAKKCFIEEKPATRNS